MKSVISISLGSSSRDAVTEENFDGEVIRIARRGTDGDKEKDKKKPLKTYLRRMTARLTP